MVCPSVHVSDHFRKAIIAFSLGTVAFICPEGGRKYLLTELELTYDFQHQLLVKQNKCRG